MKGGLYWKQGSLVPSLLTRRAPLSIARRVRRLGTRLETRVINTFTIRVFRDYSAVPVKNNMAQVGLCASMLWPQTTQRNRDWVL